MQTKLSIFLLFILFPLLNKGQNFEANGGVSLKIELLLGAQHQYLRMGLYSFGQLNYGQAATEAGGHYSLYFSIKRHGVGGFGVGQQYELFGLAGWGKNSNLLGSAVAVQPTEVIFNPKGSGGFGGLGFGINKDILPAKLRKFNSRRGNLILRYSNSNYSFYLNFSNDVRAGFFKGQGTDLGATGSLLIGAVEIRRYELRALGVGLDVFTPEADYLQLPRNPQNSDDGWRNVWQNLEPYADLFHANLYIEMKYQKQASFFSGKLGIDSPKLGAYIQNSIHDSFGLYPRFSWPTDRKNQLFWEFSGGINAAITNRFNHLQGE